VGLPSFEEQISSFAWLHRVGVANLPEDYAVRLNDMAPGQFKHLILLVPDPYDCILSKLEPAQKTGMTLTICSVHKNSRLAPYANKKELRHNLIGNIEWHNQTLDLWIDIFESRR
jgi:hypothetical protein